MSLRDLLGEGFPAVDTIIDHREPEGDAMTLIDKEALRTAIGTDLDMADMGGTGAVYRAGLRQALFRIAVAEPVCCERCESYIGDCDVHICDHERGIDYPLPDDGCVHFTRREAT